MSIRSASILAVILLLAGSAAPAQEPPPVPILVVKTGGEGGDLLPGMGSARSHFPGRLTDSGLIGFFAASGNDGATIPKPDPAIPSGRTDYGGVFLSDPLTGIRAVAVHGDIITANIDGEMRTGFINVSPLELGIFDISAFGNISPFSGGKVVFQGTVESPVELAGQSYIDVFSGIFKYDDGFFSRLVERTSERHVLVDGIVRSLHTVGPVLGIVSSLNALQINRWGDWVLAGVTGFSPARDKVFLNGADLHLGGAVTQSLKLNDNGNVALLRQSSPGSQQVLVANSGGARILFQTGQTVPGFGPIAFFEGAIAMNKKDEVAIRAVVRDLAGGFFLPVILIVDPVGNTVKIPWPFVGSHLNIGSPHAFNDNSELLFSVEGFDPAGTPNLQVWSIDFTDVPSPEPPPTISLLAAPLAVCACTATLQSKLVIQDLHGFFGSINSAAMNNTGAISYQLRQPVPSQSFNQATYVAQVKPVECHLEKIEFIPVLPIVNLEKIASVSGAATAPIVITETITESLVDENPNSGAGKRIYPGKTTPDDVSLHDLIIVKATVLGPTEKTRILMEVMDVDDPSAGDPADQNVRRRIAGRIRAPLNHVKFLNQVLCHEHEPALDWEDQCFDNRGDFRATPGGAGEETRAACEFVSFSSVRLTAQETASLTERNIKASDFGSMEVTSPCGHPAEVKDIICHRATFKVTNLKPGVSGTVFALLKVSRQPGDNYRVTAVCDDAELKVDLTPSGSLTLKGKEILDKLVPVQDDQNRARVVLRDRTIDPRKGHCRNGNLVHAEIPATFKKAKVSELLTVWRRLHLELDRMEATPFTTTQEMVIRRGTKDFDFPIADSIAPDIAGLERVFPAAYVTPADDLSPRHNAKPLRKFRRNLGGNVIGHGEVDGYLKETRDLTTRAPEFWVAHLSAGYEHDDTKSNDPDVPSVTNTPTGISGGIEGNSVGAMVFHETARDVAAMGGTIIFGNEPPCLLVLTRELLTRDTYAHETGHLFELEHTDGGIMNLHEFWCQGAVPLRVFSEQARAKIRCTATP